MMCTHVTNVKKTFKTKGGFTKHMKGHSETIAKKTLPEDNNKLVGNEDILIDAAEDLEDDEIVSAVEEVERTMFYLSVAHMVPEVKF